MITAMKRKKESHSPMFLRGRFCDNSEREARATASSGIWTSIMDCLGALNGVTINLKLGQR